MVHLIRKNLILYFIRVVVKLLHYTIVPHIFTTHNEPQNLFVTKFYPAAIYLIAVITIVFCHSGSAIDFQSPAVWKGQEFSSLAPSTWGGGEGGGKLPTVPGIHLLKDTSAGWLLCFDGGLEPVLAWCTAFLKKDLSIHFCCWAETTYRCNIIGSGTVVVYQKTNFLSSYVNIKGSNRGNL